MPEVAGTFTDSQWRIKNVPDAISDLIQIDSWRYVAPDGSDDTGNGTIAQPFASLSMAFASIVDATPTKRYAVWVTGSIAEVAPLLLPPNIYVVGASQEQASIAAPSFGLSPLWAGGAGDAAGLSNLSLESAGELVLDFEAAAAPSARFVLSQVDLGGVVLRVKASTSANALKANAVRASGSVVFEGGSLKSTGCRFANVSMSEVPGVAAFALDSQGDRFTLLQVVKTDQADSVKLAGSYCETLIASGLQVIATADSLPGEPQLFAGAYVSVATLARTGSNRWSSGSGSPEGVVNGQVGDLYSNLSVATGAVLWVKEAGAGDNVGWVGK
jgi:hypothetical protein